jgi:hypothetical protein
MRHLILVPLMMLSLAIAAPAGAKPAKKQGAGKPTADRTEENCKDLEGDKAEACKVIGQYLDLWKKQKWDDLRKLIHPKTLETIARTKKNIGMERHSMAPWYWAKEDFLLTDWKVQSVETAALGTIVVNTVEDSYRVEEDGFASGDEASYIAGKYNGKWYVADRHGGGGGFSDTAIKVGLKGFFDIPEGETVSPVKADLPAGAPKER